MGPPRKIDEIFAFFGFVRPTQKMGPEGPKQAREDFFPTNPDLADILGRTDLDFVKFVFLIRWTPNLWISRSPDLQIPKIPDFQISRFPDAAGGGAGRTLRSQPDPSPNAPRDQIRRKEPLRHKSSTYVYHVRICLRLFGQMGFHGFVQSSCEPC